jgi:hypothetical protein
MVVGLAYGSKATGPRLFAVTYDHRVWSRNPTAGNATWKYIGSTPLGVGVRDLTYGNSHICLATTDDQLWARAPSLSFTPQFQLAGHATHVSAMTYAASTPVGRETVRDHLRECLVGGPL